ncbi:hypothetical protein CcaverHIS002_0305080 [Cutaneotrichosporon cavernicola]|nr:hypothetical protein CcaverHIS002_0305080 [Cutaneotrichosporon cavernicola]
MSRGLETPPVLASIGTVLIDIFEPQSAASLGTSSAVSSWAASSSGRTDSAPLGCSSTGELHPSMPSQGGVTAAPPGSLPARENPDEFDDLPRELEEELLSYGPNMWVFNRVPGGRVPRARIGYNGAVRSYAHIIKPVPRTALDLAHGPLFGAEYLHVSPPFSSSDLLNLLSDLPSSWNPKVVFEPAPSSCHPAGRRAFEAAAQRVHALSPNHEELLSLYDRPVLEEEGEIRKVVEEIVAYLLGLGVPVVAVRCGASGACIGTVEGLRWVPSFFEGEQHRVRDVTGAGNAFIGGYIAGLRLTGDPYTAALYGMVSASFVIEQLGPPSLSVSTDGELWNGDSAQHRLAALSERVPWA